MWRNWRARQTELSDLADFFEFTRNPVTAGWIRLLAKEIGTRTPRTILESDFQNTLAAWKLDFAGNDELRTKRLDSITTNIFAAVGTGKLNKVIRTLKLILRELGENEVT